MADRNISREVCTQCIEKEKALAQRWKDVKNFVQTTIIMVNRRAASHFLKFLYLEAVNSGISVKLQINMFHSIYLIDAVISGTLI